jgi:nitrate reductase assembly molybdenum cofactor insertion protein NarJ
MIDDYFALFNKTKKSKNDFEKISIKFKELKILAIKYKEDKEREIGQLKDELSEFKNIVQESKNSYEEVLDRTTKSIEEFIENAEVNHKKNVQ